VRISQIQDQKRRNRNVHFGCIVPWPLPLWLVSIYLDVGYLEVAYPGQGNARALTWDKRGVELPTSFRLTINR
jgi:hypothetical protein